MNTVLLPTQWVIWDVTSCKIETAEIKKEINSIFSLYWKTYYQSYNVCTKEIIEVYSIPHLSDLWISFLMILVPFVLILFVKSLC